MQTWTAGDVKTNGVVIHYTRTASATSTGSVSGSVSGEKPQVVLCHGFSNSGLCWTPLAKDLEADYDVVMVDARCHGQSTSEESGNNASAMAEDLAGLITALKLDRPVVAGHSMGATYTEIFAARYPDQLRALILEDAPWSLAAPELIYPGMEAWQEHMEEDIRAMRTKPVSDVIAECERDYPTWSHATCTEHMRAKFALSFNLFKQRVIDSDGWRTNLPKITCPILVFTGEPEQGAIINDEIYAAVSPLATDIQRVQIPKVGHHIFYEAPETYTQAFKAFLTEVYGV